MTTPSRQAPLKLKCVGNRRSQKALTFVSNNNAIDVGAYREIQNLTIGHNGEAAERAAKEVLCPPSPFVTGEEQEIFTSPGYLSASGQDDSVELPLNSTTSHYGETRRWWSCMS
ncbi:unnamed protein product [Leuciscus chuanchicus]